MRTITNPNVYWQKLLALAIVWLATEILLTLIGLDNLADYSEFVFERNSIVLVG